MELGLKIEPGAQGVAYCRVSSRDQAKGFSPEYQLEGAQDCAKKNGIELVREWSGTESAKEEGRPYFNEMLAFLKAHPKVRYILMAKVDRMSRNHADMAAIEQLVKSHNKVCIFFHEGFIYHKDSDLSDFIRMEASSMLGRVSNRDLQEKTRRGLNKKAAKGQWPNRAPYGYLNDKATKLINVDPVMRPWIIRIKELAATARYSCEAIAQTIWKEGCPKRLSKSAVHYIIRNPIYYGYVAYQDIFTKGVFEPIITKEMHDAALAGLERLSRPKYSSHNHRYRGILKCACCECAVVFEPKKGHVYGHCTYRRPCRFKGQGFIREEEIDREMERILGSLSIGPDLSALILRYLEETAPHAATTNATELANAQAPLSRVKTALDAASDNLCRGVINEAAYMKLKRQYEEQMASLQERVVKLEEAAPANIMPLARATLELSNCCCQLYKTMNDEQKRELLDSVCSNFLLDGKNIVPQWRKPFELIAQMASCSKHLPD